MRLLKGRGRCRDRGIGRLGQHPCIRVPAFSVHGRSGHHNRSRRRWRHLALQFLAGYGRGRCLRRGLLRALLVGRVIVIVKGFELALKLELALLGCPLSRLHFGLPSRELCLPLLCLGLSRLLPPFLLFLLELTLPHLFLECLEASLRSCTLLFDLILLCLCSLPVTMSATVCMNNVNSCFTNKIR